jgi:hypothetical protein
MDMAFSSVSVTFFFLLALHRTGGEVDAAEPPVDPSFPIYIYARRSSTLLATNPSIGINDDEMDSFSRSANKVSLRPDSSAACVTNKENGFIVS